MTSTKEDASAFDLGEEFLAHYGVKGMRWGVRNDRQEKRTAKREASIQKRIAKGLTPEEAEKSHNRSSRNKKLALGAGVAAVVAVGAAFVISKYSKSLKDIGPSSESVKATVKKIMEEPTGIVHVARGKYAGYGAITTGGLKDVDGAFLAAGNPGNGFLGIKRFGVNNEKILAAFQDPLGRKDHAGRLIVHDIIIPKGQADGVNTLDDVISKIWPQISDRFQELWELSEIKPY